MLDQRSEFTRTIATPVVRRFYEENPFPYYDLREFPTYEDLKRRASGYVHLLDQSLGSRAKILEVGCGTGQLSSYLAHRPARLIVGVDFSRPSLALARRLREQLGFSNLTFLQADLFRLPLARESFDFVLCHGVLHHTPEPRRGLSVLAHLLKPGGGLAVGLYHRLGRRGHWRRARKLQETGRSAGDQSEYYRTGVEGEDPKKLANWRINMYQHPGESGHLLVETVRWFRENGLTATGSAPSFEWGAGFWSKRPFFDPHGLTSWQSNALTLFWNDLKWWARPVENGYFVVFGCKES